MKAVCIHEFGGVEKLCVEEVPDPEPRAGYVRLRVVAAPSTTSTSTSARASRASTSRCRTSSGSSSSAPIDKLGEGVGDWKVGDRVMPYLLGFTDYFIGVGGPGGFAEYCVAPAQQLVRVPDEIGDEDAAALQVAFGTAWHMLFGRARLAIGETVLITSVSAGIASAAVQLANLGGAYVIGTLELAGEARPRDARWAWTPASTTRPRTSPRARARADRRQRRRRRLRARRRQRCSRTASTRSPGTGGWSPAAATAARSSRSTSSRSSARSTR